MEVKFDPEKFRNMYIPQKERFWLSLLPQLRYRIPKQVTHVRVFWNEHGYYVCPGCDASLDREYTAYCDRCGQRLDWTFCEVAIPIYILPKKP